MFREASPSGGLGDVSLGLKARLPSPSPSWQLAIEGQLELPTGDEDDLYGSGSVDLGAQLLSRLEAWKGRHEATQGIRAEAPPPDRIG